MDIQTLAAAIAVAKKINSTPEYVTAAVEAWLSEHVDPSTGYVLDDTLTTQGAAADAKKAGDEISGLKSAIADTYTLQAQGIVFDQGSYTPTSASTASSAARVRSHSVLPDDVIGVKAPSGMYFSVFAFDQGNVYVGRYINTGIFSKSTASGIETARLEDVIFDFLSDGDYKYKLTVGHTDDSNIVPTDASALQYYKKTDETLSMSGKSADAKATADAINDVSLQINGAQGTVSEIVTVDMTKAQLAAACDAQREAYTALCLCNAKAFMSIAASSTLDGAYEQLNRNFRREVYVPGMTKKTVIDRINRAFTEPVHRFEDARLNLDTPCDFSIKFEAKSGEPSLIVSEDGGELWVYGYNNRFKTRDGMAWTTESLTLSDGGVFGHAGLSVIDGTIFMIARDYRNNNDLIMYTSPLSDGLNFTYQGVVLEKGHNFGDGLTISNWGNSCMCKINGTYYLYIEGKDSENRNFWDTYLVTCTDPLEAQQGGTIGNWVNSSVAPIISGRTLYPSVSSAVSVGNPDFAKGPDNRPVRDADGKWYMYVHSTANSYSYINRLSSADLVNWSDDGTMYDNRIKPTAGQNKSSNADQAIIEFKGRTYFFYTTDINTALDPHLAYMIDDRPIREIIRMRP